VRVTPVWVIRLVIWALDTWTVTSGKPLLSTWAAGFGAAVAEDDPNASVIIPVASINSAEITRETPWRLSNIRPARWDSPFCYHGRFKIDKWLMAGR
jgi:hypothetical protein